MKINESRMEVGENQFPSMRIHGHRYVIGLLKFNLKSSNACFENPRAITSESWNEISMKREKLSTTEN